MDIWGGGNGPSVSESIEFNVNGFIGKDPPCPNNRFTFQCHFLIKLPNTIANTVTRTRTHTTTAAAAAAAARVAPFSGSGGRFLHFPLPRLLLCSLHFGDAHCCEMRGEEGREGRTREGRGGAHEEEERGKKKEERGICMCILECVWFTYCITLYRSHSTRHTCTVSMQGDFYPPSPFPFLFLFPLSSLS